MRLTFDNGRVIATVVTSDNPGNAAGTVYRLIPQPQHTFAIEWVRGGSYERTAGFQITMCGDQTPQQRDRDYCGA